MGWHGDPQHSGFDPDIASTEARFGGPVKSWQHTRYGPRPARTAGDPQRCGLLHDMYASIGRMNDAVVAGDRRGYEREMNRQVELRGCIANALS